MNHPGVVNTANTGKLQCGHLGTYLCDLAVQCCVLVRAHFKSREHLPNELQQLRSQVVEKLTMSTLSKRSQIVTKAVIVTFDLR